MDAEAYPEASKTIMTMLWDLGTSVHQGRELQWAKSRASAFESLTQYEVNSNKWLEYFNFTVFCLGSN